MSYWKKPLFRKYYRKWQKRKYRKKLNINILENALREYYQTVESVEMIKGKRYTPQQIRDIKNPISKEDKPPEDVSDPLVMVGNTSMRESDWNRIIAVQALKGVTEQGQLTPDDEVKAYLLSLFRDETD